jgi:allophanate hydrolase subunit 1
MSRPRSGQSRANPVVRGGGGSRTGANRPGVFVAQPKSDIYVVMLGIALGAMFLGSILLSLVLSKYQFKVKATAVPAASVAVA